MPTADQLAAAAEQLGAMQRSVAAQARLLERGTTSLTTVLAGVPDWWTGPRAQQTTAEINHFTRAVKPAIGPLDQIAARAHAMVGLATELARQARRLETERNDTMTTMRRSAVTSPAGPTLDPLVDPAWSRLSAINDQLDAIDERWTTETAAAARFIDGTLAGCGPAVRADIDVRRLGLVGDPVMLAVLVGLAPGLHPPTAGRDPAQVASWWASLDDHQRRALASVIPGVIGNLDGIPLATRATSIRRYMNGLLDAEAPNGPLHRRLDQFIGPDGRVDPNRKLIAFDTGGDGRVAEYFGNFADADHVTLLVPGMGSTMSNFSSGVAQDARKLWGLSGPGTSVIAWTGYDAPAGAEEGLKALEVASARQAEVGGRALHSFIDGLHTESTAPLTLIAHSYGSLTAGKALSDGAQVTNVVFIGSPGVGVDHVRDFPPGAAQHFYAGEVKGDPVATTQHFGDAPTDDDFGAFVFDAGRGDSGNPLGRHSEYFDDGTAIDNLVAISTGGTPTPGHATPVERFLEFDEDIHDFIDRSIDVSQGVHHIPLIDRQVDAVIDGMQSAGDKARTVRDAVGETAGHYVEDGVGWVKDNVEFRIPLLPFGGFGA